MKKLTKLFLCLILLLFAAPFVAAAAPVNDDFANAIVLTGGSGSTLGSSVDATHETEEPSLDPSATKSVWWDWTAANYADVYFDTRGSNFDTILGVFTGTDLSNLTLVTSNDDVGMPGKSSGVFFSAVSGITYHIVVDGYNGASGNIDLNWTDSPTRISGTVYQSDGVTPLTTRAVLIWVYSGPSCADMKTIRFVGSNPIDGSYQIDGLPVGSYYLRFQDNPTRNINSEWWAEPRSVLNCEDAQTVVLSTANPNADGVDFQLDIGNLFETDGASGVWKWDGTAWTRISSSNPHGMLASGSTLYGDFESSGLWLWNGEWSLLTASNPENMTVSGNWLYASFGASGLWQWHGSWDQLTLVNADNMAAKSSLFFGDFGALGLWLWTGRTWIQLTPIDPVSMIATGNALYAAFESSGLWSWNGVWSLLTPYVPEYMIVSGGQLYADFGSSGLWQWDDEWTQLSTFDPQNLVAAGSTLYADFGSSGLWQWDGIWMQLPGSDPQNMATAGSTLYGDFETNGLWKWDGGNWTLISVANPVIMCGSN